MGGNMKEEAVEGYDLPTYPASLPVPNVQEMARRNPMEVPERYIRSKEESPKATEMTHPPYEIPVIDLSLLSSGQKEELRRLDLACKEWGFFQVVNHGVPEEVLQGMRNCATQFFQLPPKEKNKYATTPYDIQGYGHAYVVYEEQKLNWSNMLGLLIYPTRFRNLKFWPRSLREFKI